LPGTGRAQFAGQPRQIDAAPPADLETLHPQAEWFEALAQSGLHPAEIAARHGFQLLPAAIVHPRALNLGEQAPHALGRRFARAQIATPLPSVLAPHEAEVRAQSPAAIRAPTGDHRARVCELPAAPLDVAARLVGPSVGL
jgi:hypothetical protein